MASFNEKQKALIGKWELESSENFDEFLKELGLNVALRTVAKKIKPRVAISLDGDEWTIKLETLVKNETVKFKMGKQFDHKSPIGVSLSCLVEMDEDGRITETQEILDGGNKGQKTYLVRYIDGDRMVTDLKTNDVEAKRIYVRSS